MSLAVALLLVGLPSEATATAGATTTATAPMILTPSGDAVFKRSPVGVVLRAPQERSAPGCGSAIAT